MLTVVTIDFSTILCYIIRHKGYKNKKITMSKDKSPKMTRKKYIEATGIPGDKLVDDIDKAYEMAKAGDEAHTDALTRKRAARLIAKNALGGGEGLYYEALKDAKRKDKKGKPLSDAERLLIGSDYIHNLVDFNSRDEKNPADPRNDNLFKGNWSHASHLGEKTFRANPFDIFSDDDPETAVRHYPGDLSGTIGRAALMYDDDTDSYHFAKDQEELDIALDRLVAEHNNDIKRADIAEGHAAEKYDRNKTVEDLIARKFSQKT